MMKMRNLKSKLLVALGFILFGAVPSANASNGLRVIGFGARNLGLGGAGVAQPQGANSIYINPAGMNDVGNEASLDIVTAFTSTRMGTSAALAGNPSAVSVGGTEDPVLLPSGALVMSFLENNRLSLGIGTALSAGFQAEFPVSRFPSALTKNQYDTSGKYANLKIEPAASFRIRDNLSIGVGLDINYAFFQTDSATLNLGFPETTGRSRFDSALGIGGRIGILYKPIKRLQIGAMYVTRQHFQRFDRYKDLLFTGLDLPQEVAVGLAVEPFKGATFLADFRWINWGSGFTGAPLAQGGLGWRDQYVLATGFEYNFDPRFDFPAAIRIGYNYGRSPIPSGAVFQNALIPTVIEHHLTTGVSYEINKHIGFDAAYIHEFEHTVTDDGSSNPVGKGSFVGASANVMAFGIHGRWGGEKKKEKENSTARLGL
ncbi:MAG: outer membrane protein transport protein [bacterium]